jgi:NAD(P)-dependent dehydrogenase (short-subunit alcohol dehydrogenase family)
MVAQKSGVFIHISSVGALRPKPKIAYCTCLISPSSHTHVLTPHNTDCATKAAIIAISKSIAIEYAPHVRSVVIAPSMGNTGMCVCPYSPKSYGPDPTPY